MLTVEEILAIVKAIDQSSLQHFELEQGGARLLISKGSAAAGHSPKVTAVQDLPATSGETAEIQQASPTAGSALQTITAPMIGTFYAAPEPGSAPFVIVGQQVDTRSVVCVLEAMKLFNEVEAGIAGKIIEVLVKDGEFVEYGQPLFRVKPN